ncbi:alpha/beta-hydrolase [Schizopora paradoxa]|uniref:Carboxylic ester hydrolase n=1 Tax=Schizopora paradoxa TaxID=27342 RepID=A0A0H2S9A7_9AGAM|nr:alpha/beta-hydrolase [Schizopora paradoxa]
MRQLLQLATPPANPTTKMLLLDFASLALLVYPATFAAAVNASTNATQVVDLGYAKYKATLDPSTNVTNFLGIRFAAPPIGKLRFQAPKPPLVQQGIQLANVQPAGCPQANNGQLSTNPLPSVNKRQSQASNESIEDCLMLNVHVPGTISPGAKLPVIFFIHGGGYVAGTTTGSSGSDIIRDAGGGGLIGVESEYRLGIFGFLAGEEVKKHGALNTGLLDQNAALEWIQKYIHLFGGDPEQVTIWGQSAGAGSVLQHLVAHKGNTQPPLFQRAMTSSTFLPSQYNFDDPVPEFLYNETVRMAGCTDAPSTFDCLVALPAAQLEVINTEVNVNAFSGTYLLVPVVDGEFIQERPVVTMSNGKLNADTVLMVTNTNEGVSFVNANVTTELTLKQYVADLMPQFSEAQVNLMTSLYEKTGGTITDQAAMVMGESIFICPSYTLVSSFQGSAHKAMFAIPPATHAFDVQYYFGDTITAFNNPQFIASFRGVFISIIKSGSPNDHPLPDMITPEWPAYKSVGGRPGVEMLFNVTEDSQPDIRAITTNDEVFERCEVWKSLAADVPQ